MRRIDEKCEENREKNRNATKKIHSLRRFAHFHHILLFVHIVHIFDRDVVFDHRFSH
jgi:hypothetical protein